MANDLLRRLWILLVAGACAIVAIVCGWIPLVSGIGWEFASLFAVPVSLAAGFLGIAVSREYRERSMPVEPAAAWARALPALALFVVPPIAIGLAHGLHVKNCTPSMSLEFWLLEPVGAGLFSLAIGVALGRAIRSPRKAGALFTALVLSSLVGHVVGSLHGPALYFADHFFGFFSGPIYDEVVPVDPALWYLRLLSFLIGLAALLAAGFVPDTVAAPPGRPALAPRGGQRRRAAELALVLAALAVAWPFRKSFRIDVTELDIQRGLGGHATTDHFEIWYDRGSVTPEHLALLEEDHEFRFHTVTTFLKIAPHHRIVSYVFPNEASKKHWTGAGGTQVANPWRGEIYVNDDGYPLPVLEHELTHALSHDFGIPLFGYAMYGHTPVPSVGMIEGIAVAASFHDRGSGTPHEQAAAMLKDGLLPKPEDLVGLGFWGERQARAYTTMGSFVRFLADTYGVEKVERAYPWGDFEGAFGKGLPALAEEWRTFLETIPVPPQKAAAARDRFTEPSLFERTCARELARLEADGWDALQHGRYDEALARFEAWREVDDRTDPLRAELALRRRQHDAAEAARLAGELVRREIPDSPAFWRAKLTQADLAWERGDPAAASDGYREVFEAKPAADLEREAWIKLAATERARDADPAKRALAEVVREWLAGTGDGIGLGAATARAGDDFVGEYLAGRSELQGGQPARALVWLDPAAAKLDAARVDSIAVRAETLAMRADALTRLGRGDEALAAWQALRQLPGAPGDVRDRADDGAERARWKLSGKVDPAAVDP